MRDTPKRYIGDGVYVGFENGMLKVTTNDGYRDTNTIFFESEVWSELVRYVADIAGTGEADREKEDA